MKKMIIWTMALVFSLSVSMAFAAEEKAGEKIEKAGEKVGEKVDKADRKVKKKVKKAKRKIKEKME